MRRISMSRAAFALLMLTVVVVSAAAALGTLCAIAPWRDDVAHSEALAVQAMESSGPVTLRWDTPVVQEWRDTDGELIGSYTTTLYDYANDATEIGDLRSFDSEISTVMHWFVTDPEMRGHLLRHGVSTEQMDAIASHFEAEPELEAFLAYHER